MKIRTLIVGIVALLGTSVLQAQSTNLSKGSLYAGASAIYAASGWENVKDGYGLGLNFGGIVKEKHYVEAELMYLKFDTETHGSDVSGDVTLLPVLATYRYEIPLGTDSQWSLQAGASVGMSMMKYKVTAGRYSESGSKWVGALGAQANIVYQLNSHVSFNAGIRALWTAEADFGDDLGKADSATATLGTVGVNFHF